MGVLSDLRWPCGLGGCSLLDSVWFAVGFWTGLIWVAVSMGLWCVSRNVLCGWWIWVRVCGGDGFGFGVAGKHHLKHSVVFFFFCCCTE